MGRLGFRVIEQVWCADNEHAGALGRSLARRVVARSRLSIENQRGVLSSLASRADLNSPRGREGQLTLVPIRGQGSARQSPVQRLHRVAAVTRTIVNSLLLPGPPSQPFAAGMESDVRVGKTGASRRFQSSEGTDRSASVPVQGQVCLGRQGWRQINARHDETQDQRAAVGRGSSPRRPEVRHRASRQHNAR